MKKELTPAEIMANDIKWLESIFLGKWYDWLM